MDVFPKFIIEGDRLILGKVTYHKNLVTDPLKVKGGGWFRYLQYTNTFVFYGDSHDFGAARFEDIKKCVEEGKVFKFYRDASIADKYNFGFDTQTEIIELLTTYHTNKTDMSIQTKVLVETPTVPNFIKVGGKYVHVGELTESTLKEVAKDWTNKLLIKADQKRREMA